MNEERENNPLDRLVMRQMAQKVLTEITMIDNRKRSIEGGTARMTTEDVFMTVSVDDYRKILDLAVEGLKAQRAVIEVTAPTDIKDNYDLSA